MNKEIELINKIIEQTIIHGGDPGGPYYTNSEGVYEAINNWLKFKGLDKEYNMAKEPGEYDQYSSEEQKKEYWKLLEQFDLCQIIKKEN